MVVIQAQIQALLAAKKGEATERPNIRSNIENIEVTKPLVFNREARKIGGSITVCKLYLRIRIREVSVEEQIQ